MSKEKNNIIEILEQNCCFDLQFRQDIRHERTGSPTYYRWKIQFVVTLSKEKVKDLKKIKNILNCGNITTNKNQARLSVQKQEDINNFIIPYFKKNKITENKKKDQSTQNLSARPNTYNNKCSVFELWQKAVKIIYENKGKYISKWKNNDLLCLIEIHKTISKYKNHPRQAKWIEMAKSITKIK